MCCREIGHEKSYREDGAHQWWGFRHRAGHGPCVCPGRDEYLSGDIEGDKLAPAKVELETYGTEIYTLELDVTDRAAMQEVARQTEF